MRKNYNKIKADGDVKWCINYLINGFFCRMFEVKKKKMYLCLDHWKYLDWRHNATRVLVGNTKMKDGYYYQTNKLK